MAEKCKPWEIYRRMCDVHEEASFSEKNVYNWVKNEFDTMRLSWKDNLWSENILISVKKKIQAQQSVKKVILTVLYEMKGSITIDFLEKEIENWYGFGLKILSRTASFQCNMIMSIKNR